MPKISIILPVYNSEKFIANTLESLINQTFQDIEIVCVNDGSTDKSYSILKEYAQKDNRIKVFTQENSGPAKARNVGLQNSTGKYIMFCDSDDLYKIDMCEKMFEKIENIDVDVAMCSADVNILDKRKDIVGDDYIESLFPGECKITNSIISRTNVFLWNKIFKKELIDKYSITFPDGHVHDDPAFVYMYFSIAKNISVFNEKLYIYQIRSGSVMDEFYSNKKIKDYFDIIFMLSYVWDFLCRNNLTQKRRDFLAIAFILYLIMIYTYIDKSKTQLLLNEATKFVRKVGLENLHSIKNKELLNAIFNSDFSLFQDVMIKVLKLRLNKFLNCVKHYQNKVQEITNIIEDIDNNKHKTQ